MTRDDAYRGLAMEAGHQHRHLIRELTSAANKLTLLAKQLSNRPQAADHAASELVNIATTLAQATAAAAALHAFNTAAALLDEMES